MTKFKPSAGRVLVVVVMEVIVAVMVIVVVVVVSLADDFANHRLACSIGSELFKPQAEGMHIHQRLASTHRRHGKHWSSIQSAEATGPGVLGVSSGKSTPTHFPPPPLPPSSPRQAEAGGVALKLEWSCGQIMA